jgi:riboflavin synthase
MTMFTGLIESVGTVLDLRQSTGATRIIIAAPELAGRWKIGDSIAVNGVCLTAVDMHESADPHPGRFAADLAEETLRRTSLAGLQPGSLVNLELPTRAGAPLGGHVVQGHVDTTGKLCSLIPLSTDLDNTDWRMSIEVPEAMLANIIPQGSIAIDGISLTVAKIVDNCIEIAIIPHTYKSTNLRSVMSGSRVNLEADVLSRYAQKHLEHDQQAQRSFETQPVPAPAENFTTAPAAAPVYAPVEVPATVEVQANATPASDLPSPKPRTSGRSPRLVVANDGWLTQSYLVENGY